MRSLSSRNLRAVGWFFVIIGLALCVKFSLVYSEVGSDFMQDYAAATALRRGLPVYGETIQKIIDETAQGSWQIANNHPPSTALLFLPFSLLPYTVSFIALNVLSLILLIVSAVTCSKELAVSKVFLPLVVGFCLCWYPVLYCLGTGQSSILIAACVTFGWLSLHKQRSRAAGSLFGVAVLFKLFPGLIALYLVLKRRYAALLWMLITIFCGIAASIAIGGIDAWHHYTLTVIESDMREWNAFVLNVSLSGAVERLLGEKTGWVEPLLEAPAAARMLQLVLQAGLVLWLSAKLLLSQDEQEGIGFSLTVTVMLLVSPIMWAHIFPILIYPLILLLTMQAKRGGKSRLAAPLLIIVLLSIPDVLLARLLMSIYLPNHMPWHTALLLLGPTVGLILLCGKLSSYLDRKT